MQASHAASSENQIAFAFMSESDLHQPQSTLRGHYALGSGFNESGLVPVILSAVAAGAVVLGLIASNAAEPLLLTLLALFAMLGVFLVFGVLAGHIRIGERVREDDLVKALADSLDDGVLVTRQDGAAIYANRSFKDLAGLEAGGDLRGLDTLFSAEPRSAAAFFRLSRAASRGEPWREEIEVAGRKVGEPRRLFRVAERPCTVPGHERELGPMVLWSIQDVTDERARQASAMHTLESTLERLDAAPVGLMEVDGRGVVRRINATFLRWLEPRARRACGARAQARRYRLAAGPRAHQGCSQHIPDRRRRCRPRRFDRARTGHAAAHLRPPRRLRHAAGRRLSA